MLSLLSGVSVGAVHQRQSRHELPAVRCNVPASGRKLCTGCHHVRRPWTAASRRGSRAVTLSIASGMILSPTMEHYHSLVGPPGPKEPHGADKDTPARPDLQARSDPGTTRTAWTHPLPRYSFFVGTGSRLVKAQAKSGTRWIANK